MWSGNQKRLRSNLTCGLEIRKRASIMFDLEIRKNQVKSHMWPRNQKKCRANLTGDLEIRKNGKSDVEDLVYSISIQQQVQVRQQSQGLRPLHNIQTNRPKLFWAHSALLQPCTFMNSRDLMIVHKHLFNTSFTHLGVAVLEQSAAGVFIIVKKLAVSQALE